jgi:hypothetical protein
MQRMKGERKGRTCFGRWRCLQRWWVLAYCFSLSSFCVHLSVCSFCFLSSFWSREDDEEASLLGVCFDSGFFVVCRDESNGKSNTTLCVVFVWFVLSLGFRPLFSFPAVRGFFFPFLCFVRPLSPGFFPCFCLRSLLFSSVFMGFSSLVFHPLFSPIPPLFVHLLCSIFIGKRTPLQLLEWSCSRWDSIY